MCCKDILGNMFMGRICCKILRRWVIGIIITEDEKVPSSIIISIFNNLKHGLGNNKLPEIEL